MRRSVCIWVVLLTMCGSAAATEVPAVSAASCVLMDGDSGRVLYGYNEDAPGLVASTTKLMTALVALESGHDLSETVTIRPEWTGIEGSSLYLKPGENIRLETLLYGLLLRSGNDAAQAVAGYCAGSGDAFVDRMNGKARELGMENTHFSNPSGLDGEEHFSTARDMAILARACLENEVLRKIVSAKSVALEGRVMTNHNKLLWRYEGCIGLKTGYTRKAGRTLVSAASRDGMTLICVTLNAPDDWRDHESLLDYGFENYERRCLVRVGDIICRLPVWGSLVPVCEIRAGETLWAALKEDEKSETRLELNGERLTAPTKAGTAVGRAVFLADGQVLGSCVLEPDKDIPGNAVPEKQGFMRFLGR